MPAALFLKWDGVTPEQYEQIRATANWEGDLPDGAMFHVAAFTDGGMRIFDVWASAEAFQTFFSERVMPAIQEVGLTGEPEVELLPVHALFTPAYTEA
jgi:hypothetical protein